ncbi:MAG: SMI1/KNR4 family protein [Saccharospirillaceae bacterium]|nr:SMI1/KNR4 family protein [Pseudomonadales bacterium]NRB80439.1 SMI1/KNR4 family protein [Saccharospirillaceae bacterium]
MIEFLPLEYVNYLKSLDKLYAETTIDIDIEFEPLDKIKSFNKDIEIEVYAKGFYAFACDGGNEAFVFDREGKIYLLPLIGMSPNSSEKIAESWNEFLKNVLIQA